MRTKVLPLDYWMQIPELLADCLAGGHYPAVLPRYHRPGLYLQGKDCWFEIQDGRAFCFPRHTFCYQLALLDAERLTIRQAAALAEVVRLKLATRAQRQLLYRYQDAMAVRQTYRSSRKHCLSIIGRRLVAASCSL